MKTHRFYIDEPLPNKGTYNVLDLYVIHHAADVVRLKSGEPIALFNGEKEVVGTVDVCAKRELSVRITDVRHEEKRKEVILYQSIVKGDHMDMIVEKATEVGVTRIVPLISDRTIKTGLRLDRMERIMIEASEQSGRIALPTISEVLLLKDALSGAQIRGYRVYVCDFSPTPLHMRQDDVSTAVFIGPEGGWSDAEREMFAQVGASTVSLGSTVLRAETAAIVSVYLLAQ